MFNIGNELLMRKLVNAPPEAWACVELAARLHKPIDDVDSLVNYEEITSRLANTFATLEGAQQVAPEPDHGWITKDPKSPKETDRFAFPEIENHV